MTLIFLRYLLESQNWLRYFKMDRSEDIHDKSFNSRGNSACTDADVFLLAEVALFPALDAIVVLHVEQGVLFRAADTFPFPCLVEGRVFWAVFHVWVPFFLGFVEFDDFLVISIVVDIFCFDIGDIVLVTELALFVDGVEIVIFWALLALLRTHVKEGRHLTLNTFFSIKKWSASLASFILIVISRDSFSEILYSN